MTFAAFLEAFWKPILCVLLAGLVWIGWKTEEGRIAKLNATVTQQAAQIGHDTDVIKVQNKAVDDMKLAGQKQQASVDTTAQVNEVQATKVEVQWKTKYVPQPIPVECTAAVAAGAENAAGVARLFQTSP